MISLTWFSTRFTKFNLFSGVITYRVKQTHRLVNMTTNRRAGNPGTPGVLYGGTNQICNIGGKVVNDIKTNLTALEISVSKVVESTPKTQPQTKHEKNHIFEKKIT